MPLRLISQQKSAEHDDQVELGFESQNSRQSRLIACCVLQHPFYVRNKGNINRVLAVVSLSLVLQLEGVIHVAEWLRHRA